MPDVGNNRAGLNCPACGTPMYYGEKFCPRCGHKIEMQQAMPMLDKSEPTVDEGAALSSAERKTVFSSKETVLQPDVAIMTEKCELIQDTDGRLKAKCTFRNLGEDVVKALRVDLRYGSVWGDELGTVSDSQYLDLSAQENAVFGETVLVPVLDENARTVSATVKTVMTENGPINASGESVYVPAEEALEVSFADAELAAQYRRDTSELAKYVPWETAGFWRCACGGYNRSEQVCCRKCRAEKETLFRYADTALLKERLETYRENRRLEAERAKQEAEERERLAEERRRQEEQELARKQQEEQERTAAQKAHKKRIVKRFSLISAAVIVAAVLAYGTVFHLIPLLRYNSACKAMETGDYEQALTVFQDLGDDYRDCAEKANNCSNEITYKEAEQLFADGKYEEAAQKFDCLGVFSDSNNRAKESRYHWASECQENGDFEKASQLFRDLNDYKDSENQKKKTDYLWAERCMSEKDYPKAVQLYTDLKYYADSKDLLKKASYSLAEQEYEEGRYDASWKSYAKADDYEDAKEKVFPTKYLAAEQYLEEKNYEKAATYFEQLGSYEDSAERLKEPSYYCGLQYLKEKQYIRAVTSFENAQDYEDSKDQLNEAMYLYVKGNKNSTDVTTYHYLKELKKSNYKDSKDIYENLYSWFILTSINSSEDDTESRRKTISKYDTIYCHMSVIGGPPNPSEGLKIKCVCIWPDGSYNSSTFDWEAHAGTQTWYSCWYDSPAYGSTGALTFKLYNAKTGEMITTDTVTLTN